MRKGTITSASNGGDRNYRSHNTNVSFVWSCVTTFQIVSRQENTVSYVLGSVYTLLLLGYDVCDVIAFKRSCRTSCGHSKQFGPSCSTAYRLLALNKMCSVTLLPYMLFI